MRTVVKGRKSTKKPKSKSSTKQYKRTDKKVDYKGRKRTVYVRVKDGKECIRCKDKSGKVMYRQVASLKKMKGGCGCAATTPANMSGGSYSFAPLSAEYKVAQDGGAQKLEKNKKDVLYKKARKYGIKGRSKMTKADLIRAVRSAQRAIGDRIRRSRSKSPKRNSLF